MKKLMILAALMLGGVFSTMAQDEKCYRHQGDGFDHDVYITIKGSSATGHLNVGRTNSEMPTRIYQFTGTVSKGVITMRFADAKVNSSAFPAAGSRFTATLSGGKLVMKVWNGSKLAYSATFTGCE